MERIPVKKVNSDVAAIAVADMHLSLNRPIARGEPNWADYQESVLKQLAALQDKYECPILIAGDVFDRWDTTAACINHALIHWPCKAYGTYGVPGNHDLPHHVYTEIHRSAYWTLVEAGKLRNLTPPFAQQIESSAGTITVTPFPCSFPIKPNPAKKDLVLRIALIHDLIWTEKTGYPGADESKRYGKWINKLTGFDVAIFGDNHKGFLIQSDDKCSILNVGTLMCRKATEMDYKPSVGLIHINGKVSRHYLNISKDKWADKAHEIAKIEQTLQVDLDGFVKELTAARQVGSEWSSKMVDVYCKQNKVPNSVKQIMMTMVEGELKK